MAKITAVSRVEIAALDLEQAAIAWRQNFDLTPLAAATRDEVRLTLGGVEIRLLPGSAPGAAGPASEPGMRALWLEADDVAALAQRLDAAGVARQPIRIEQGRRVLEIDPVAAGNVALFIFDQKG